MNSYRCIRISNLTILPGLQVETGFVFEKDREEDVDVTNFAYNTTLIKYGVNEFFELRLITEYLGENAKVAENPTSKIQGFSPFALGVKIKLADELLYGRSNVRFAKNRWEICREAEMRFVTTAALKIPAASSFYCKNFVIRTKSTW